MKSHSLTINLLLNMKLLFSFAIYYVNSEFSFLSLVKKSKVYFFLNDLLTYTLFTLPVSTFAFDFAIISFDLYNFY